MRRDPERHKLSWSVPTPPSGRQRAGKVLARHPAASRKDAESGQRQKWRRARRTNRNGGPKKRGLKGSRVPHSQLDAILKGSVYATARGETKRGVVGEKRQSHYMKLDGQSEWSVAKRRSPGKPIRRGPLKPMIFARPALSHTAMASTSGAAARGQACQSCEW